MKNIRLLPIFLGVFFSLALHSQEVEYMAKEYINEDGKIYWNKALPVFLRISSNENDAGVLLKSEHPAYANPIYLDTEGTNYIRTKYAVNKETKKTVYPKIEVMMPVIADGSAPISTILFQNAKSSFSNGVRYYGPNLSLNLSSTDKYSGVELLVYNLDSSGLVNYSEDFIVSSEGKHSLTYYGVDRVGNRELTQTSKFTVDVSPPSVTHNINGIADNNVIASSSKIYFTASDELSGLSNVFYRFDKEDFKVYNGSHVNFAHLNDGEHNMEYYAIDKVGNETPVNTYIFYFDKTAPLTASDLLGDRFVVNDKIYFSGRTKMKLTAVDNKIGVKEIKYSIDQSDFEVYDQPFYLPSIPGEHQIRFYSIDRLSNQPAGSESYKHNINLVYLDLTGPDITHSINGPSFLAGGVQYISPKSEIRLAGKDGESGLQYLTYSIDGNNAEQIFERPFTITNSGNHKIELFGYDNVNNRNVEQTEVYVDATPPEIFGNFSVSPVGTEEGRQVYPIYVTLFLAATDNMVGNDKIYYQLNNSPEILYTKPISKLKKNTLYTVNVRAIDMVGNEASKVFEFKTSDK